MKKNKLILKSGLQSKYYLSLQSLSKEYPTQDDLIFECINHVLSTTKKITDVSEILFSKSSLKEVFGDKLKDNVFLSKIKTMIQTMIQDGSLLKPDEETLSIPTETINRLYSLA